MKQNHAPSADKGGAGLHDEVMHLGTDGCIGLEC